MKGIRIAAKKRWRQRKSNLKKCVENVLEVAGPSVSYQPPRDKSPDTAVVAGPKPPSGRTSMSCKPQDDQSKRKAADKLAKKTQPPRPDKALAKSTANHGVKESNPQDVVRSEKTLGCGTFGVCYLAHFRGIMVAVKEFRLRSESRSVAERKREVLNEAHMINLLGNHRGLPLLFGVITKEMLMRLVTQFHGHKHQSVTLKKGLKNLKLDKPSWLAILTNIIEALDHVHKAGVLHNDLKSNNVLLENCDQIWNPVVIDFGKARLITNPKPVMSLSASAQERYAKLYPHIATEIVIGTGQQSVASDIFSLGRIALAILDLLPTATAHSLRMARKATTHDPVKRPSLEELSAAL